MAAGGARGPSAAREGGGGIGKRSGKSSKKKSGRQKADRPAPVSGDRPESTTVAAPPVRTMERQLREEKEARDGLHSSQQKLKVVAL